MRQTIADILVRWEANGGSAWDRFPTFIHHLAHILISSLIAVVLVYKVGVDWEWVAFSLTALGIFLELFQYLGWIGKPANGADSFFDAFQYQSHWIFYWSGWVCLGVFYAFAIFYFWLLLRFVDENGNPKL